MFALTSDIQIGQYKVKPSAVAWRTGTGSFTDTCRITLPLSPFVRKEQSMTDHADGIAETASGAVVRNFKEVPFKKDDKVTVCLGYNGRNKEVFRGFVNVINYTNQLIVECEGYNHQLRNKYFSKSYKQTTLRKILLDLISGTDIKLSPVCDDIPLQEVWFKNAPGHKVLEWVQKELCCRVWFDGEYLYAGASKFVSPNPSRPATDVKVKIGWNTVSADDLKKQQAEEVEINIVEKDPAGTTKKTKPESKKYSNVKEVKVRAGLPANFLQKAVQERQQEKDFEGYEGSIVLFGEPHVWKSDKIIVTDDRFPERSGNYFAEDIEGEYGEGGFRRKVKLRYYGKNG